MRNKESSQRFRDRTKERQKEKDQRLEYLERRVYELENCQCVPLLMFRSLSMSEFIELWRFSLSGQPCLARRERTA